MNPTLSMALRYAVTAGMAFAIGKGWLTPEQSGPVTDLLINVGGAIIVAAPAVWAAFKVDNRPLKS